MDPLLCNSSSRARGAADTYTGDLPLDVLQEVLLAADEVGVLELRVVLLRLHQPALLDVHNLAKAI